MEKVNKLNKTIFSTEPVEGYLTGVFTGILVFVLSEH